MYNYQYVSKAVYKPEAEKIHEMIREVQDLVREYFTFQYRFIGSSALNMITYDPKSNKGFDFDVNIYPNYEDDEYAPFEVKKILMAAFNKVVDKYGYGRCEDSTRVFTIKVKDVYHSKILHSCDFAIVHDYVDDRGRDRQEYIHNNKQFFEAPSNYSWEDQPIEFQNLRDKIEFIKKKKAWKKVRDLYIEKKNNNTDPNKKSRSLRVEAINEIAQYYGY